MADEADFGRLKNDLEQNGQLEPVITLDGKVLDGRNREKALIELGVAPRYLDWDDLPAKIRERTTPSHYVTSRNLARRHMKPAQIAMTGARLIPYFEAEREKAPAGANSGKTAAEVAAAVGSSTRSVERAKAIAQANPKLAKQVEAGEKSLKAAEDEIKDGAPKKASGWTRAEVDKDEELAEAFVKIEKVYGKADTDLILHGGVPGINRPQVLLLSQLTPGKMREMQTLIISNRWLPKAALRFLNETIDGDTTLEDMTLRCLAQKGYFEANVGAFLHTCQKTR